jgi:quercetin dioxygenase-like cupin family protein
MRLFDSDVAQFRPEFGALASRWEHQSDLGGPPFGVMWCRVEPRSSTAEDSHPERELITVARGSGAVRSPSGEIDVATGQSVLLASGEAHVITNRSPSEPLVVLSVYWLPDGDGSR